MIPSSLLLLIGVSMLARKTLIVWLSFSAVFLVLISFGVCAITIIIILLDIPIFAIIFSLSSLIAVLLLSYLWKNVYSLCKSIENDGVYALNNVI